MKKTFLLVLLLFLIISSKAQLKIDGEYRPRFEYRDGYKTVKTVNSDPAYFVTQRTRLNLLHNYNNITSKLSVQDYRVWGESNLKADDPITFIAERSPLLFTRLSNVMPVTLIATSVVGEIPTSPQMYKKIALRVLRELCGETNHQSNPFIL